MINVTACLVWRPRNHISNVKFFHTNGTFSVLMIAHGIIGATTTFLLVTIIVMLVAVVAAVRGGYGGGGGRRRRWFRIIKAFEECCGTTCFRCAVGTCVFYQP